MKQKEAVLVLGAGKTGLSAIRFLEKKGVQAILCAEKQGNCTYPITPFEDALKQDPKTCIVSPGISLQHPWILELKKRSLTLLSDVEFALSYVKTGTLCIGITGTNGKTTATLLLAHIMQQLGKKALAVGNVGVPLLDVIEDTNYEVLVVELSSFQLELMRSPAFHAGAILNITEDHLDRHGSLENYAAAKARLSFLLLKGAPLFIQEKILKQFPEVFDRKSCFSFGESSQADVRIKESSLSFFGTDYAYPSNLKQELLRNSENLAVVLGICFALKLPMDQVFKALSSFSIPSHRLEWVRSLKGVEYFNDSKATNPASVLFAVQALKEGIILIAGGKDKGCDFKSWVTPLQKKVEHIVAMGETAPKILDELSPYFPISRANSLEQAVEMASQKAGQGAKILFSPGCSSFDLFANFEERGKRFKEIVNNLTGLG